MTADQTIIAVWGSDFAILIPLLCQQRQTKETYLVILNYNQMTSKRSESIDLRYSKGFRAEFKEFRSGVWNFSYLKSDYRDFGPDFKDFSSDLKGFRPYSKDFTSDFQDFRNFASDFKVSRTVFRYFCSDFTDNRDFDHNDFRSDFKTFGHRISEVVGPMLTTSVSFSLQM